MVLSIQISFARPIGPYDMLWNKCVGKFCHVDMSMKVDKNIFQVLANNSLEESFHPEVLQSIILQTKKRKEKRVHVCFYVMWGETVSVRFLDPSHKDPFLHPPSQPTYENITIPVTMDQMHAVLEYNLKQIGKPYDIPRAILLFSWKTLPVHGVPTKFFCSQLVLYALEQLQIFHGPFILDHMTPTSVYDWLLHEQEDSIKTQHKLPMKDGNELANTPPNTPKTQIQRAIQETGTTKHGISWQDQ